MLMALLGSSSSEKPRWEKPFSSHFNQVPRPLCPHSRVLHFLHADSVARGRASRGGVRAAAALVGVVCHPALHSLGSTGRDKTACCSIMNVSGWWIHYNNITIGSTRNTLYLNLSFSMVMHCVQSSCFVFFFFLLVLSDADNSGGEKSRSKIIILDSLVWVNCRCQETRGCAGGVCVRDTQRQRQKERQRKREDVKLGKGERRWKQDYYESI